MNRALSTTALAELRRPRPYPAVSIVMPTHRREPDNAQDPVVLRNLIAEATKRIEADPGVSRADRIDVLDQIGKAIREVDLVHAGDGLAVFAAPGEHQVWTLARDVPARVVLADTFLTRNLVAAHAAQHAYWVLAVSADHISLWSGTAQDLTQHADGGFPLTRSLEDPDAERKERIGDLPSTFRDEQTRQFLRAADAAATAILDADPRRLYVVGEAAALSLLEEVGTVAADAAAQIRRGGLARGPAESLHEAIQPVIDADDQADAETALADLSTARGQHKFAAGIDEVWQHVAADRAGTVVVEEHYQVSGRQDADHLVPATPGEPEVLDDVVDEIIERALDSGAHVHFVPDDSLADAGRIAAVLRY